ncbi:putative aliphatic sulfonates transport permease protein SsuC [Anoxybacillus sp. P3H1B]|uniref:ABC transporter permease n=1 Tax=Anoxybacillaceae TaxID=3120669 RepID=UPI000793A285|nr:MULTISPECIES: ABC transporter permease [Anoxybacillus]KXG11540.1 putative aliphatic sulfonates transport permease protein SsuC [Anoxybacillus sp. P3H1B]MBS2772017.1 ABC transporter permease [Anoxybacillus rupiensis]OQM45653.1 ABC transporter permease [Anoxybacillus sp. UARK-01]
MNKTTIVANPPLKRRAWSKIPFQKVEARKWISPLLIPLAILIIWQLFGQFGEVSKTVLPTPFDIATATYKLILSGELVMHLKISTIRALSGFLIGAAAGLIAGIAVGFSTRTEEVLDPTLQMLRTIPHLAVAPLFILWLGFGEASKVLLIAKGAFFPIYVNTFLGIRGVDAKLFDVARIFHFNTWQKIKLLIFPSALPNVLLGIRLSLGAAWLSLVVAELMGSTEGIGYMMMDARQFSNTDIVFVGIILFALAGKVTDSFVRLLEKWLLRWQDTYKGTM